MSMSSVRLSGTDAVGEAAELALPLPASSRFFSPLPAAPASLFVRTVLIARENGTCSS
ncbi:hypothetical protein [uncultured Actinomyces sp.]|uniref:hypothetical protein n=1 Tax=uncultured Actinomyces sp. TaxID=249061 RepID=UPI0028DCE448|nr:hypothetical protein [uncultured Actinomyces sp.]